MKLEDRNRSTIRRLILETIDGKKPMNTIGMMDPRLFTGEVELIAVQDTETMLWSLRYNSGNIPAAFKQQFTSFRTLLLWARNYFLTRNIQIVRVID